MPRSTCGKSHRVSLGPVLSSNQLGLRVPLRQVMSLSNSQPGRGRCLNEALPTQKANSSIPADCESVRVSVHGEFSLIDLLVS